MIETISELRSIYKSPAERALAKQITFLEKHAINFIEKSPFCIISTIGKSMNMDASPRGGEPGFVKIVNEQKIVIPDSRGNNRLDSIENIVETGRIGMLFIIPGIDETLRLNGKAYVSTDPQYLDLFKEEKFPVIASIVVELEETFLHCAKAFMRSKLWSLENQLDSTKFPSIGEMIKDQINDPGPAESREDMIKRYESGL